MVEGSEEMGLGLNSKCWPRVDEGPEAELQESLRYVWGQIRSRRPRWKSGLRDVFKN